MNTEPLRYVAAIVIGGKGNKITPTGALYPRIRIHAGYRSSVTDKNVRLLHVLDNNGSSKIANGRFTTRRTAWQK